MTRMNSSRCFRVAAALVVVVALAAPAAAVSVGSTDVPEEAQVGTQVTATVTLTDLYRNPQLETWELRGQTELRNVTWVVAYFDQTGARTGQDEFTGQELSGARISADDDVSEVEVRVTGTVPPVESYSYDPPQQFLLLSLTQAREGGAQNEIDSWQTHYYTNESRTARQALDAANATIGEAASAGADVSTARETFRSAVNAYNDGNFDNAERLANRAESEASSAQQSSQTRQQLLLVGGGLVVLLLIGGGFFYWRSNQGPDDPLG
ncbi:MAG: hypothetical protein ABEH40_04265 [Haloferacaceae archaeon]